MANSLNQQTVADVTKDILVSPLTGKFYPCTIPGQYGNVYEWVQYKVEQAGENAPTQQDADDAGYLRTNALALMKDEITTIMTTW
jgi:hypothetical protein